MKRQKQRQLPPLLIFPSLILFLTLIPAWGSKSANAAPGETRVGIGLWFGGSLPRFGVSINYRLSEQITCEPIFYFFKSQDSFTLNLGGRIKFNLGEQRGVRRFVGLGLGCTWNQDPWQTQSRLGGSTFIGIDYALPRYTYLRHSLDVGVNFHRVKEKVDFAFPSGTDEEGGQELEEDGSTTAVEADATAPALPAGNGDAASGEETPPGENGKAGDPVAEDASPAVYWEGGVKLNSGLHYAFDVEN